MRKRTPSNNQHRIVSKNEINKSHKQMKWLWLSREKIESSRHLPLISSLNWSMRSLMGCNRWTLDAVWLALVLLVCQIKHVRHRNSLFRFRLESFKGTASPTPPKAIKFPSSRNYRFWRIESKCQMRNVNNDFYHIINIRPVHSNRPECLLPNKRGHLWHTHGDIISLLGAGFFREFLSSILIEKNSLASPPIVWDTRPAVSMRAIDFNRSKFQWKCSRTIQLWTAALLQIHHFERERPPHRVNRVKRHFSISTNRFGRLPVQQ